MTRKSAPKPPAHLRAPTRKWFAAVLREYELEEHHRRLLLRACEAWDRGEQAREAIKKHGLTFVDRHGDPKSRPEVVIERQSMTMFARLVRELDLDVEPPPQERGRPPGLRSNRRR